jgi:glycosyltransferase involved in cell wall biosynthesis
MRILFVTGLAHLPQSMGGVQSSTDSLISMLAATGHEGAVACTMWGNGPVALAGRARMKLTRKRFARDRVNGYPCYRAWDLLPAIPEILRDYRPDVAVIQHVNTVPLTKAIVDQGVPAVIYFRNAAFDALAGDLRDLPATVRYIANSQFSARVYGAEFGVTSAIIPPLIRAEQYRTEPTGKSVVMINPHPTKGIDIALAVARMCPDIPFRFIQSWELSQDMQARMTAAQEELSNVTLLPATRDMKSVYAQARIVLAPSQWDEAWGRVASEAHVSGIPVIGSDRGGLPEAIGPGGIVIPADAPAGEWADAVRRVWAEDAVHAELSGAAIRYSQRQELQPEGQLDLLLDTARNAVDALRSR